MELSFFQRTKLFLFLRGHLLGLPDPPPAVQIDTEAWRARAARTEAEARTRAEEDVSRQRSSLRDARSALEEERGDLLRRVARAEAAGEAAAAEVWLRFNFFSVQAYVCVCVFC